MLIDPAMAAALERVSQRAADALQAFVPGAFPHDDDVATPFPATDVVADPLSVAAPADDYFATLDERGRTLFTRDGAFAIHDGALVGEDGSPILGYAAPGAALAPLRIDPVDAALGRVSEARVDRDGLVSYAREAIDPRTQRVEVRRVALGRIALARFPAGTRPTGVGAARFVAPAGVAAQMGRPGDGNFGVVTPRRRERSRIDLDRSLLYLGDAYRALDALRVARDARIGTEKTAADLLK